MKRKLFPALLASLLTLAITAQTHASAGDTALPITPVKEAIVSPHLAGAMQRDFGLSRTQVDLRLAQEARAAAAETVARRSLGASFGGAWFDAGSGRLVVHTTGAKLTALPGVEVRTVTRSQAQLDAVKASIDQLRAPQAITGWHVDVRNNDVVVSVNPAKMDAAAKEFIAKVTALDSVRITETSDSPRLYADVVGGWPMYMGTGGRCSIGFAVHGGFVTAGHCGRAGTSVTGHTGELLGYFAGSWFPGRDHAWVRTVAGVNLHALVYGYNGYYYYVYGSNEMPVGAGVCRSGSTTGMYCGTIQAKNQTVNYPQGTVVGLTQTNVCAEPGDSGGSWLSSNQAQGVTSGGSGNCSSGGTTYFQPVNPILSYWGLSLLTA